MSTLAGLKTIVTGKVRDESARLSDTDLTRLIGEAIKRYSKHRPDTKAVDVTGNATHDYSLPSGWVADFSSVLSIEFPIGEVPESLLESDEWAIYQTPTEKKLRLLTYAPSVAQSFRVTFTILRADTTIPSGDEDAVCNLAAALCLQELANMFVHSSDPTIAADSVDYKDKAYKASKRASEMLKLYQDHMGLKPDDTTPAASATADFDVGYPGGYDRLTHPRRQRERR